jgi:hypothetical protein
MYFPLWANGEIWRLMPRNDLLRLCIMRTVTAGILRNLALTSLYMIGRMLAFTNKV